MMRKRVLWLWLIPVAMVFAGAFWGLKILAQQHARQVIEQHLACLNRQKEVTSARYADCQGSGSQQGRGFLLLQEPDGTEDSGPGALALFKGLDMAVTQPQNRAMPRVGTMAVSRNSSQEDRCAGGFHHVYTPEMLQLRLNRLHLPEVEDATVTGQKSLSPAAGSHGEKSLYFEAGGGCRPYPFCRPLGRVKNGVW